MRILAMDDEQISLQGLLDVLEQVFPGEEIMGCLDVVEFVDNILTERPGNDPDRNIFDIAFLDIEMRGVDGLEIAASLKKANPDVNIIFTTGFIEHAWKAMEMHASGYIMKPVTVEKVQREIQDLRYAVKNRRKRLRVQAFGNFEAYAGSEILRFHYQKAKELLAYLVDRRGAFATNEELLFILWEDDIGAGGGRTSYLKSVRADLIMSLKDAGILEGTIVRGRGNIAIVPKMIDCDFYEYMKDPRKNKALFHGEYMNQYSWAEESKYYFYR